MAKRESTGEASSDEVVTVIVSQLIEREYERRGVFPELRMSRAFRIVDKQGWFDVPLQQVREIIADANEQRAPERLRGRIDGRSLGNAYASHVLRNAIPTAMTNSREPDVASGAIAEGAGRGVLHFDQSKRRKASQSITICAENTAAILPFRPRAGIWAPAV